MKSQFSISGITISFLPNVNTRRFETSVAKQRHKSSSYSERRHITWETVQFHSVSPAVCGRMICVCLCARMCLYTAFSDRHPAVGVWEMLSGCSGVNHSFGINRVTQTAFALGGHPNGAVLSANYVPYFPLLSLSARRSTLSHGESRLCWTVSPNRLRAERWSLAAPGLADNKRLAFSRSLASSHPFIAFVAPLCEDLHVGLPNFNLIVLFSASHHQRCHSKPFR